MYDEKKDKFYVVYTVIFVVILVVVTISLTYAWFGVPINNNFGSNTTINAQTACLSVEVSEEGTISATKAFPITDEEGKNSTPVTVTVKNICKDTDINPNISYKLVLTSLVKYKDGETEQKTPDTDGFIPDDKMRIQVKKQDDSSDVIATNYVSSLTKYEGNHLNYLKAELNRKAVSDEEFAFLKDYDINGSKNYIIKDSNDLPSGASHVYEVRLWIDYYEGNPDHNNSKDQEQYDKTTQGKSYAAAISAIIG